MTSTRIGQLFTLGYTKPLSPFTGSSVVTLPYAKLTFSGGNIYYDAAMQNLATNPVVADANGRFVPIYMNPALQYGVALTSSGNISLWSSTIVNVPNPNQPAQVVADTLTQRVSTTTLAVDPYLTYAIPGAGTYKVEMYLVLGAAAAGATPGIKFSIEFSGSLNASAGNALTISGLLNNTQLTAAQSAVLINGTVTGSLAISPSQNILSIAGTIQTTSSGTLALYWAQNASSTNYTEVYLGSALSVTQIG